MKLNNNGFTLVELIIVIAIVAILSVALAPSVMKYINQAAIVTDQQTCKSLEKMIYTALTDDENHDLFAFNGGMRNGQLLFLLLPDDTDPNGRINYVYTKSIHLYGYKLGDVIDENIPELNVPKEAGKYSYLISVNVYETTVRDDYSGTNKTIYTIGDINSSTTKLHETEEIKTFFRNRGAINIPI